jgi:hypothetical protein
MAVQVARLMIEVGAASHADGQEQTVCAFKMEDIPYVAMDAYLLFCIRTVLILYCNFEVLCSFFQPPPPGEVSELIHSDINSN